MFLYGILQALLLTHNLGHSIDLQLVSGPSAVPANETANRLTKTVYSLADYVLIFLKVSGRLFLGETVTTYRIKHDSPIARSIIPTLCHTNHDLMFTSERSYPRSIDALPDLLRLDVAYMKHFPRRICRADSRVRSYEYEDKTVHHLLLACSRFFYSAPPTPVSSKID